MCSFYTTYAFCTCALCMSPGYPPVPVLCVHCARTCTVCTLCTRCATATWRCTATSLRRQTRWSCTRVTTTLCVSGATMAGTREPVCGLESSASSPETTSSPSSQSTLLTPTPVAPSIRLFEVSESDVRSISQLLLFCLNKCF